MSTRELDIFIDGACHGNPGPGGVGVVICHGCDVVKNISEYIGNTTNNVAEYTALIYALQEALILKAKVLNISTDSELLYRQINKIYKVKNPNISGLYHQALHLMSAFEQVCIRHIPREQNAGADKLAGMAVKKAKMKK